jgi:hypothetical protein
MSLFNPESLLRAMGVEPAKLMQFYEWLQAAVVRFNEKLNAQQAQLDRIEASVMALHQRPIALIARVSEAPADDAGADAPVVKPN